MKQYFMLIILLAFYSASFSQSSNYTVHPQAVWIKGHLDNGNRNDSFQVLFWKEYINHLTGVDRTTVQLDDNGDFNIQLPAISHIARISFLKRGTDFTNLGNFAAEPGDSLQLRVYKPNDDYTMQFQGRGAAKYNVLIANMAIHETFNEMRKEINARPGIAGKFNRLVTIGDSLRQIIYSMINQNKASLTPAAYQFLRADCTAYIDHIIPLELWATYQYTKDARVKAKNNQRYLQFLARTAPVDETCAAWSIEYLYTRIAIEQAKLFISSRNHSYTFTQLFNQIKTNYRGLLREKIMLTALIDAGVKADCVDNDQPSFDLCLKEAYDIVETPFIKTKLGELIAIFSKGQPAYDFALEDTAGNRVRLHDLRGKVVLLDLWFSYCTGCMQFAEKMKNEIMPQLRDDTSFVVVSVNTDESRSLWLNSLAKNLYSDKEHVNLFTGGVSFFDAPLVQHYQIQGAPFILLIDKNGAISARIPMSQRSDEIVAMIKEELGNRPKN